MDCCYDGKEAISTLSYTSYDAVILDIMVPKADGFAVLRSPRGAGETAPAFFLTAKDAMSDRMKDLDSGANDYLVKPFTFEGLSARLHAVARVPFGMVENVITIVDLMLDYNGQAAERTSKDIGLPGKEYALLRYFM